jgi:predicted Zn finger-like uncharacterized protein
MRIRCERCQAEYELDDNQLRGGTRKVQCSVCGHVFIATTSAQIDDARPSYAPLPAVSRETATGGSHQANQGGLKLVVCLTVAAGVAFAGIGWQRDRAHNVQASGGLSTWKLSRRPTVKPPEPQPNPAAGAAAVQNRGPMVEPLPAPPPEEPEKAAVTPEPESPGRSPSYDSLVAGGDRALEHGANAKAKELYQKALRLRSGGAQALSGLGFVALDRGQIPAAYELFKRALSAKPSLGPAVFGMAEIHRARGEKALALNSYQHYLILSPNGREAAAARRQVSELKAAK